MPITGKLAPIWHKSVSPRAIASRFLCATSQNYTLRHIVRCISLRCFGRIRFRGSHPSRRHSSVRLHSGDSLGTGAADAASVAAHAHRMPCRLSGRPSKAHLSLRPQFNFPSSHPHSIRSRLPPLADIGRSAVGCVEPGAEAACLFYGTPGMSHAKRCADKGVANEGWDPKNRQPRSDRLLSCRSVMRYIRFGIED